MIVTVREPYRLHSSGREWWAVDCANAPPPGWKAAGPSGWLDMENMDLIEEWCKKNAASPWGFYLAQALFESYDDATLFYLTFVQ